MPHRHVNASPAGTPPAHPCLPCLGSGNPEKRACALRRLMAEGLLSAVPDKTDRPQ